MVDAAEEVWEASISSGVPSPGPRGCGGMYLHTTTTDLAAQVVGDGAEVVVIAGVVDRAGGSMQGKARNMSESGDPVCRDTFGRAIVRPSVTCPARVKL